MTLTDESPMPFGKHVGTKMANVPASWLLWFYDQRPPKGHERSKIAVRKYIEQNLDALKQEGR